MRQWLGTRRERGRTGKQERGTGARADSRLEDTSKKKLAMAGYEKKIRRVERKTEQAVGESELVASVVEFRTTNLEVYPLLYKIAETSPADSEYNQKIGYCHGGVGTKIKKSTCERES
eukprot:118695-Hanusia_phi.AAC.5